ncbi:putative Protein tyrosine and serine/threonine kinase [Monocercomonoides exilis]|uniref:putative Protein tyrosine and serine/threonine kinase n=1 Tax=Monocercomonoides exilis TaxID=2049356 RepID=UPI00355A32F0|nr:putative Protein tyrosine and serine/threonine kinase [Monocercomonoides exilis]|eukprot:MONOS_4827.1-p1 / transcript=MONOS_4827.1 / gene=MONOS_4827 / organism=Monocercomonoides_exilis_PA203 / gene_product=unspecified product / transcript_product=unspecified product / location=Mono_scaffold00134:43970-52933(+) / protein_length=2987 / sequence_SO=supercontig / SO=protein_coding / is_pseudo=false
MQLSVIFFTFLACIFNGNAEENKYSIEQQPDDERESEKIFLNPQVHSHLGYSSIPKTFYNNSFHCMRKFQQSTSVGNTEVEGEIEKINFRNNMKETRNISQTFAPETSSKYFMRYSKKYFSAHIQSEIEGCICGWNSSIELWEIELVGGECGGVMRGRKGSVVVVRGCVVGMGKDNEAGAFDLSGSIGVLANITLKGWGREGEIYSGRLFGGKGDGGEKSGGEEKEGGERGRGRGREGDGDGEDIEGSISVSESRFSSFCVSSAPFLSSPSISLISLSKLSFFNISTANDACSSPTASFSQTSCLMNSCSFSSVCDAYDGGIVHSLNNPYATLTVSNTSFIGCYRVRNVEHIGTEEEKKHPGRQNITENGENTFVWCEWNGSKTTGESDSWSDGISSGGAICMYSQLSAAVSVSHCAFNECVAHWCGGGISCYYIRSVEIENNSFNSCTAQTYLGGGMCIVSISSCVRISGCEFQNCKAIGYGGGLHLENFQVSGIGCVGNESGEGESACVFDCCFTSCSITNNYGGGMRCYNFPVQVKIRSIQFISCSALREGGGLGFDPNRATAPDDGIYCYFLFFHECKCSANTLYGHDVMYYDRYGLFNSSNNPFYECYTTNENDKRVCYGYDYSSTGSWKYQHTEKWDWLKDKTIYVSVKGNDSSLLCGANETFPCLTVKKAFEMCEIQISLAITLMEGNHVSETTTIEIGEKKILVIGTGKDKSSIGTGALSSVGALFSVTTGNLGLLHMKVDCNSNASPSSPSVVVVSDGGGSLSLEDVVITTSKTGDYVMSSSVFVVPLSQLSMVGVEIKDMNVSKPLFSEPNLSSPSSSSSLSSSALYLTATASRDSVLANAKVTNVKLTEGDGVVVAKSVKVGETFVVKNMTIEDCECKDGSGGGIKVEMETDTCKLQVERTTAIKRCRSGKYGGGMMLYLAENSIDFSIVSVDFSGCSASLGGNYVFVNGSNSASWGITTEKLDVQHDDSKYNELVGYDRSDTTMGLFPLNVYLDRYPDAAHVGKGKNGLGGYNSWFCGFDYYPCATITHATQVRYPGTNKKIELDSGYELAEEVGMTDGHEWEISCATKGMEVGVKAPENFESSCLIDVQSICSVRNIKFCIPSALSCASSSSLITSNSTLLTLTDCSVVCSSENSIGYSFVNVIGGKVKVEGLVITETLIFGEHSLIEFGEGVESVVFCGCEVNNIEKRSGDGGWVSGVVGPERDEGKNGIIVIESCVVKGCRCAGGRGGGMSVVVKGEGSVIVNGSCVIDGCEAKGSGESSDGKGGGRGGGMMIVMESRDGSMKMESGREGLFVFGENNKASYGKDVFVGCGGGVLLESKVNGSSFAFFDYRVIPTDVLKLCGSEDGREGEVIPLFVYLCSIGSKLRVDGRGERALDQSHCGFEEFGCLTIDYCVEKRASSNVNEIEVASESWIKNEMKVALFGVSVSGKEEGMRVIVRDEGSISQNNLIECTKSFEMRHLSFVLNEEMNGRRSGFIHSSSSLSTITMTSCSISFGNDEMIGYNVICVEGGGLIVDGFVMEGGVTLKMNGKSPIVISNGVELEMNHSRMNGVGVTGGNGGGGGGCLNVEMKGGSAKIEECNLSSVCSGGSGMKGGGMKISVGKGGRLEMKNVKYSGCEVPREDIEEGGRGMGGGMFVKLADEMGTFVMEGMEFVGCDAWKGKNMFVSGWDLREIVNEEHLKWEMSERGLRSLDGLCGWERMTTGEEGYVIPLVVYLWRNWSGDGFVSREKGGDFSGCGYSEAPCSSIDHLISLRYPILGEGDTHIRIVGSGLLSHSISFSSSISESQKVVIEGTKKGTGVTLSDEDENDLDNGSMISSNVSLSFVNVSFTKPAITTHHEALIESSGANTLLSVSDCSFGPWRGVAESFGYYVMRVDGGSVLIEKCTMNLISDLKGLIAFRPSAAEVTVQNMNISFVDVTERSLISMMEEADKMNGEKKVFSNGNRPVLRVVGCSFSNITNEGIGASVVDVGSFEDGVECVVDECSMSSCKSGLSIEGGGMKVVLKSEETVFKINDSSFSMCKCSKESGCGGGLFIDGSDPHANYGNESQIPPLNFKIVNILFVMNEAHVGKDIFVRCHSIAHQINETLFALNYNQESLNSNNSICGRDASSEGDVDLIPLITFYYGLQVFLSSTGTDGRRCGAQINPCSSINCGIDHIQEGVMNAILIDGEGTVSGECAIEDLVVTSFKKAQAIVKLKSKIEKSTEKDCIMEFVNECGVERCSFQFEDGFESIHNYLLKVKNGSLEIQKCEFFSSTDELKLNNSVMSVESGELMIFDSTFRDVHSARSVLLFNKESYVIIDETRILNVECEKDVVSIGGKAKVEMKEMEAENVTLLSRRCVIAMEDAEQEVSMLNCSFGKYVNSVDKGSMMQIRNSKDVRVEICVFDGEKEADAVNEEQERVEKLCKWNGSLVDIERSNVEMKETTIRNSKAGGLWASGGSLMIEKGEFENNNPEIEGYPSARRNVICAGNGGLNVVCLKGGDGLKDNSSLWMLNDGCSFEGIAGERLSSFFIPVLEEVKNTTQPTGEMELIIHGKLLLPCNLSVKISMKDGEVERIQTQKIEEDGFVSENEVHLRISSELMKVMEKKTEVSVWMVFGKDESCFSNGIVVINKSESQSKGDENENEGDDNINKGESNNEWMLIVIVVMGVLFVIFMFIFAAVVVLLRKKLRKAEKRVEKERLENEQIMEKLEKRRRENNGGSFEMSEMPPTLLEGMTSQIPLLIDNDEEDLPDPPSTNSDEILNENDLPDLVPPLPFSENASASGIPQSHPFNVISAKKPFREKEKRNIKALHSVIHSVQGDFTLGTRAMDVVDGKEVVLAVAELFEHLISVGDERVEMMARQLCPYAIFVEEGNENEIYLLTEELTDEKQKEEMKRWKAPEAGDEEEGIEKAVVFSLGLILHEMTTGEVPLSECNAEEAQEMIRDGVRPLTEGIEGEELIEVMEKMWTDEPNDRPSLTEVKKSIKKIMIEEG